MNIFFAQKVGYDQLNNTVLDGQKGNWPETYTCTSLILCILSQFIIMQMHIEFSALLQKALDIGINENLTIHSQIELPYSGFL